MTGRVFFNKTLLVKALYAVWMLLALPVWTWAAVLDNEEDQLTAENHWRAEFSVVYSNTGGQDVSVGQPVIIQISPIQYVSIPTQIGTKRTKIDALVITHGLRYGWNADTELTGRFSWIAKLTQIEDLSGTERNSDSAFTDAWLGVNHRLVREGKIPGVLAFADVALAEKGQNSIGYVRSTTIGVTTYRTNDPIVLSLTAAYRMNLDRQDGALRHNPGDSFMLAPELSFAANNDITLNAGLLWRRTTADAIDNVKIGLASTSISLTCGLDWAMDERTTLHFSARSSASGEGGTEAGLTIDIKLGELPKRRLLAVSSGFDHISLPPPRPFAQVEGRGGGREI